MHISRDVEKLSDNFLVFNKKTLICTIDFILAEQWFDRMGLLDVTVDDNARCADSANPEEWSVCERMKAHVSEHHPAGAWRFSPVSVDALLSQPSRMCIMLHSVTL